MNKKIIKKEYESRVKLISENFSNLEIHEIENLFEHSMCTNILNTQEDVTLWVEKIKKEFDTEIKEIPIENLENWIREVIIKYPPISA